MSAAIAGLRGTGNWETNRDIRPTNYREMYTLLEPNGTAPLNALVAMSNSSESTDDPKYNNFRDELPDKVVFYHSDAGALTSGATKTGQSIKVKDTDQTKWLKKGAQLINSRTGENMLVTTAAADAADDTSVSGETKSVTVVVTRAVGQTTAAAMN